MTRHALPLNAAAAAGELPARFGRFAGSPRLIVTLACLLLLLPFLSKPLHMDDPMYVWAAENILAHPLDPYGFAVNWKSTLTPMADEMKNPPLVCYYLAAAMVLLGRSEPALHLALLLPAVAVILGTYQLAKELGSRPVLAAAATLVTPVFLLSATTVMCDVTMLCSYVWAVWFWVRGMREEKTSSLVIASLLIAPSTLTKYFAVTLFPLLIAYGLMTKRRPGAWMLPLLLPVAILVAYHVWTKSLYGHGLLLDAASYATEQRWTAGGKVLAAVLTGFAFTGGCCATVVFLLAVASPRTTGVVLAAGMIVAMVLVLALDPIAAHSVREAGTIHWGFLFQFAFWSLCGFALLTAVVRDASTTRTSESALLALWVVGTFCFAVFVNWNVAGRSILPMAPAAAIVAARMWTSRTARSAMPHAAWVPWSALAPAAALALLIAGADASLARTQRDAAHQITDALGKPAGRIYFSGHWGFQHYMEQRGALPIDKQRTQLDVGDVVIIPDNNSLRAGLPPGTARVTATFRLDPMPWLSTMREQTHAGFYSDIWGPLPFAFARVPVETYQVLVVEVPLRRRP